MSDDDFDWGRYGDNSRIKFDNIGDSAIGVILKMEHKTFVDGSAPQITLQCDDGEVRSVLASQGALQNLLKEKKPRQGDRIRIVFTETKHTGQPSPAKIFTLDVIPREQLAAQGAAPAAAPAQAPEAQAPAPAAQPAVF